MNVAVCVCQVPDTSSLPPFVDGTIDLSRVSMVMNPYDEYALEEAVRVKERFAGSVVTVFTVAPVSAKDMLRKALAMGADRAVLVSDTGITDSFQTASALRDAISEVYDNALPDLVFCGKHSTDFQNAQVPAMLAELLGIACVSGITAFDASSEIIRVERDIEGGTEYMDVRAPALFSAEKGLNVPRKTTIKSVIDARKKMIDQCTVTPGSTPYVIGNGIKPFERKKTCLFVTDEKKLVQMLSEERGIF